MLIIKTEPLTCGKKILGFISANVLSYAVHASNIIKQGQAVRRSGKGKRERGKQTDTLCQNI